MERTTTLITYKVKGSVPDNATSPDARVDRPFLVPVKDNFVSVVEDVRKTHAVTIRVKYCASSISLVEKRDHYNRFAKRVILFPTSFSSFSSMFLLFAIENEVQLF